MTVQLAPSPRFQGTGYGGLPLVGGKLYTYIAGTTIPQATYVDSTQTTQNTNPVILDVLGEANVWLDVTLTYKLTLTDAFGNQIWSVDNIPGGINPNTLGQILFPRTPAEISAAVTPTNYNLWPRNGVNIKRYGATGLGVAPDDVALAAAISTGQPIYIPAGTYLLQANHPLAPGQIVYGDGIDSTILHFQATTGTSVLYGLSIRGANNHISDMTMQIDVNGKSACCGIGLDTTASKDIYVNNVKFLGLTSKLNNWGIQINGANVTNLNVSNCHFEQLDLGVFKSNSDTSITKGTSFVGCYFYNCTDGLEINQIVGPWTDVSVDACTFDTMAQFSVGIAGIQRITVSNCHFTNCLLEGVHVEATSNAVKVIGCDFQNCNQTPGVVGAVSFINGCNELIVSGCDFDLTQNSVGSPYGVTCQPGGGTPPLNIIITGNTFRTKAGSYPAITGGQVVNMNISNNLFTNVSSGSKTAYFLDLSDCIVTGAGNTFFNPTGMIHIDDLSFGTLTDSRIDGDLTSLIFLTGNTNGTTSICFDGFSIHRAFTANTASTPQIMFPSGTCFDMTVAVKFVQNGVVASFVTTVKLDWTGSALTVGTTKGSGAGGTPFPTAAQWTQASGNILAASTANATYNGNVLITAKGPYFP